MTTVFGVLALLGRLMIAAIFLLSAVGQKIPKFSDTAAYMASEGVPIPKVMLGGAIAFLIVGSLSVAAGFKARIGATLLLVFLLLATYFFHDFWTQEEPMARSNLWTHFSRLLNPAIRMSLSTPARRHCPTARLSKLAKTTH